MYVHHSQWVLDRHFWCLFCLLFMGIHHVPHHTSSKSVPTLRYTRRLGPIYNIYRSMPVGTYRVQSPGFPKIVYFFLSSSFSLFCLFHCVFFLSPLPTNIGVCHEKQRRWSCDLMNANGLVIWWMRFLIWPAWWLGCGTVRWGWLAQRCNWAVFAGCVAVSVGAVCLQLLGHALCQSLGCLFSLGSYMLLPADRLCYYCTVN